ncbi:MAG TPA: hypothetical protein VGI23_08985 [Steroidobacteraceae bacterium]
MRAQDRSAELFLARDDLQDIVPPSATIALREHLGTSDYTEHALPTGHVGLYVSRQSGQRVSGCISAWLRERS